ncbi:MAG TPA: carbonic anhydrase family protein [Dongiaceae bacterium]|nr:carbonic anhydrase family protein [Dongiaceae bacterium]
MKPHPGRSSLVAMLALSLPLFSAVVSAQEAKPPHWTYGGEEGPSAWGKLDSAYATCSIGHTQSPIDIKGAKPADLPALNFDYKAVPLNIIDNGHTIQINYPAGSTLTVGDKTYTLKQFHFHHPSEEHINGRGFAMVAHLVHADSSGNLAVVAVLLAQGEENPLIATLWKNLPAEKGKAVDVPGVTVDMNKLLPADHGYYTFAGSLTTPPCSEGVTWYVLKHQSPVSAEEVAAFAKIYAKNARPIQPTNGRQIRETK